MRKRVFDAFGINKLAEKRTDTRPSVRFHSEEIHNAFKEGKPVEEIAEQVGLTQQAVSDITKNFDVEEICNAFEEGKSVEESPDR